MQIHNSTGWKIEAMADKRMYSWEPFETKEVFSDHAAIICKSRLGRGLQSGLVPLRYDLQENQDKFSTEIEYVKSKKIYGLEQVLKFLKSCKTYEIQAKNNMSMSAKTSEFDRDMVDIEKFDDKIKQVETWISEVKGSAKKKVKEEAA